MTNKTTKKGFTLIELLVVVAIIGILSGIVIQTLQSARQKARDTQRKAQLVELQKAITRYYSENGAYPSTGGAWYSSDPASSFPAANPGGFSDNWIPGLVAAKMIPTLPDDPLGGPGSCGGVTRREYLYRSDGTRYKVLSYCALELTASYPAATSPLYDPVRPTASIQISSDQTAATTW